MTALIADRELQEEIIAQRQAAGADRWDEVWDGVYMLMPLPNDEHQRLVAQLTAVLILSVEWAHLGLVRPGVNVSDRIDDWKDNYRCPEVVIFLNGTAAENHDTFWFGGPDFAIEVVSPHDRSREKLDFYASVGTRELLLIDRNPWSLELFQLVDGKLTSVGRLTGTGLDLLRSEVVPLSFRLVGEDIRPHVEVAHHDGQQAWTL